LGGWAALVKGAAQEPYRILVRSMPMLCSNLIAVAEGWGRRN